MADNIKEQKYERKSICGKVHPGTNIFNGNLEEKALISEY